MNETMSGEIMTYDEFLHILKTAQESSPATCPVFSALEILQGKWKTHVLYELCKNDIVRFGKLKKALPAVTNTMLASTLRELETDGLANRVQYNEIPPRVEYSLTEKGKDLLPVFYEIWKWGAKHRRDL